MIFALADDRLSMKHVAEQRTHLPRAQRFQLRTMHPFVLQKIPTHLANPSNYVKDS
jgi:hypothetical protein